jgi:hypothetical protein
MQFLEPPFGGQGAATGCQPNKKMIANQKKLLTAS